MFGTVRRQVALAAILLLPGGLLAEVLVVTGADSPLTAMSREQVSDIFTGKPVQIPEGITAVPIDQPESNPLRVEFYAKVVSKSVAQVKANWAKLYFTGRGAPPEEARNSGEVKKMVNSRIGAIGYIDRSMLDDSVRVLYDAR